MLKNSRFSKFINKINPVIIFALLIFVSVIFDGAVIHGLNDSSFASQEKYIANVKKESGSDIHIGFGLESESEAARLSLLNPMNEYNAYRINENGRRVTYVSHTEYEITYGEETFKSWYFTYDDRGPINDSVSGNRFVLESGSFENLEKDNYVYISYDLFWSHPFLEDLQSVVGKPIKFSFAGEQEFIIGGVIRENVANESGLHFKRLFDQSFVLFGNQLVKKYGFNSLMFASNDTDFSNDFNDFIKAYNKSYLSFNESRMHISSFKESEQQVKRNVSTKFETSSGAHIASFFSFLLIALVVPIYVVIMLFYDFKKLKLYYKIPACLALLGYQLGSVFYFADKVKKGMFASQLSITLFTAFMILSLVSYIFVFLLFNLNPKDKQDEEKNNG